MMTREEEVLEQRVQVMGRALLTQLSQLFRNAEIYSPNNQIFAKLLKTLSNHINEAFRVFNGCSVRVSRHSAYITDQRIYIDSGMVESVHFLADLFETAEIDGLSFFSECLEIPVLFQTMLAFRDTVMVAGARGVSAIRKGMEEKHVPYLEPLPINREQTILTGLRDKDQAEKLALKNALKLVLFLKEMEKTLMEQRLLHTNLVYRILLNLVRINKEYPQFIQALLFIDVPEPRIRINFYTTILQLVVFRRLDLEGQIQLDLIVDFLFHNYGELSLPAQAPQLSGAEIAARGVRKLMEQKYVNRAFFHRLNCAFHMPQSEETPKGLATYRFLKTLRNFVALWRGQKTEPLTSQQCLHRLIRTVRDPMAKASLAITAECLGIAPIGAFLLLDKKAPVFVTEFEEGEHGWFVGLETVVERSSARPERFRWELRDDTEKLAYLNRLQLVSPAPPQPSVMSSVFKKRAY